MWGFCVYALALLTVGVWERCLHVGLGMFDARNARKRHAAGGVLGSFIVTTVQLFGGVASGLLRVASYFARMALWGLFVLCLIAMINYVWASHAAVIFGLVDVYNARVGPFVHGYIVFPLHLLNFAFKGVVPIINGGIWILRTLLRQTLLPMLLDQFALLSDLAVAMMALGYNVVASVYAFVQGLDCTGGSCLYGVSDLDVLSVMGAVRDVYVVLSRFAATVCPIFTVPIDVVFYPFLDVNLAQGAHNLVNSALQLLVHIPRVTYERCKLGDEAGPGTGLLMCTPDLEPFVAQLVAGVRDMGSLADNWMALAMVTVTRTITGAAPQCAPLGTLTPDLFRGQILSGEQATVGLTDWLLATTNGTMAFFYGQRNTDTVPRAWPAEIDPRFGVAAVSYGDVNDVDVSTLTQGRRPGARQSTTLMGCGCADGETGLTIRCSLLPYSGALTASEAQFDVWFQDKTWASRLTCDAVEITVRSVRWQVRRLEGTNAPFGPGRLDLPSADCVTTGSCESVDATIWVVPRCGLLPAELCSDVAVGTSCFPFCMAARVAGSRNANPVLVNADGWRGGKQLVNRDCTAPEGASAAFSVPGQPGRSAVTSVFGETTLSGVSARPVLMTSAGGGDVACRAGLNTVSWVPKAQDAGDLPFTRANGQPFAIAGDVILLEDPQADGGTLVMVERLTGDQRDVYTLRRAENELPAAPKRLVPIEELGQSVRDAVVVPMSYTATRVHAVSSRDFVFYAVGPDLSLFRAYLDYCADPGRLPQFQFMALSSYGPLRIYRVRAYCQAPCRRDVSAQYTFRSFGSDGFGESTFPRDCGRRFNASVEGLEYVNEQNLAVTVQVADRSYNVSRGRGPGSGYVTYWLNPQTMALRSEGPWPLEIPASQLAGLCMEQPSAPHLGTMAAEVGLAAVHLLAAVVGGVLNAPGVLGLWRAQGGACPLGSYGHSAVGTCGSRLFDVSDFFDSLDDATAIFWGCVGFFSDSLRSESGSLAVAPVTDILDGMAIYGRATVNILDAREKGIMSILNTPLPESAEALWGLISKGSYARGGGAMAVAGLSWGRYTARVGVEYVRRILRTVVAGGAPATAGGLFQAFTGTMYDLRPMLASTVGQRARDSCLGLQVMLGGRGSPWANTLYSLCEASAGLPQGLVDMLLIMSVDVPLVKCMCKDSEGHRMDTYALKHCVPSAPASLRPVLLGMVAAAQSQERPELLCPAVIAYARKALRATMDPYFASLDAMLVALGSSVDYALVGFDSTAGQCENFAQDPQVVVIMPQPIEYFQACGSTSSCQSKCHGEWAAFSGALGERDPSTLQTTRTIQQQTESLFFPTPGPDIISPGSIVALLQLDSCAPSVCAADGDECIAVATASGEQLTVRMYCVPRDPATSVSPAVDAAVGWQSGVGYNAVQASFYGTDGQAMLAMVKEDGGNTVYRLSRAGAEPVLAVSMGIATLMLLGEYPIDVVSFWAIDAYLLAGVSVRKKVNDEFVNAISYIWMRPGQSVPESVFGVVDFPAALVSGYAMTQFDDSIQQHTRLLLWPTQMDTGPLRMTVAYDNRTLTVLRVEPYQLDQSLLAKATFMPRKLRLSQRLRVADGALEVFATTGSTYDWLQLLRLTGADLALSSASISNSRPVAATVSVQTGCDGTDCRGCVDLRLRALCSAYQQCAVVRCIGTPVNLKRPLCDIGGVLSSTGQLGVEMTRGGWLVFTDLFMVILELSTRKNVPGVSISSPEDAFFGQICAAKDVSAEFSAVLLSTVNSALQLAQVPVPILQDAARLDSNANTILSLTTAALTSFFHQLGLGPVYMLAVAHKIMMCQVQGYVSLLSTSGFSVSLVPANMLTASDAISGQCLTQSAQVDVQQTGDSGSTKSTGTRAAALLTSSARNAVLRRLDPVLHVFDGLLTYFIGVTGSFAGVLQTMDLQNCLMPDVTLQYAMQCACGDQPMAIKAARRREGVQAHAFWCTGTVSVIDAQNRVRVVHNPHSYEELQQLMGARLDTYLACTAASNACVPPNLPVFEAQGVNALQVLTRCRQNYVNKQWDQVAYVQYSLDDLSRELQGPGGPEPLDPSDGVGSCLLDSAGQGQTNGACLDGLLMRLGQDERYWGYEQVDTNASARIDACMVFTGPARKTLYDAELSAKFRRCLLLYSEEGGEAGCDLSGFVWSPSSSNVIPVAQQHIIEPSAQMISESIQERMQLAHDTVMAALLPLREYRNPALEVEVFSSEGDVIHQTLDCVFLGPYARMDYWPGAPCNESDGGACLVGPYWARDDGRGATRNVDVEGCASTQTLPFTCGSPTRKAMVREFVKTYVQQGQNKSEMFMGLIREWLNETFNAWHDISRYGCECPPSGAQRFAASCCNATREDFLPAFLQQEALVLPTGSVLNALGRRIQAFYDDSLTSATPWVAFLDDSEKAKYAAWGDANEQMQVRAEALFDTTRPSMSYTSDEAMSPPRSSQDSWLWEQCHGALSKVFFTLPVDGDGALRDAPPLFQGGGVEAIAEHVRQAVQGGFEDSPLHRHYQARHHPSDSRVCLHAEPDPPVGRIKFSDYVVGGQSLLRGSVYSDILGLGAGAATLGGYAAGCFCGWTRLAGECAVPRDICGELVGAGLARDNCTYALRDQDRARLARAYRPGAWPCPYLDLTDHLGFLDPVALESWLTGASNLTTSAEQMLRYGPGGLKAGNAPRVAPLNVTLDGIPIADLRQVLRAFLSPNAQQVDPLRAAVHGCDEARELQGRSLVDSFVEKLFPMAQGVDDSTVGSYCLRFAIELSRLRALELIEFGNHSAMVLQRGVVLQWRRKCGSQVQLVGMCQALDLYRPFEFQSHMCPQLSMWQLVQEPGRVMYVTPQCLVSVDGVFYDPCSCNPEWCNPDKQAITRITRGMLQDGRCTRGLDPRRFVRPNEKGWWGADNQRAEARAWNQWQADSWNMLDLDTFVAKMLDTPNATGNARPGQHWATAEGFMNETSLFCDMIADYWPDEATFPVGYHVSVPCGSDEAAYRSFDNVFAQDVGAQEPTLVYLDDETRDKEAVDSLWGACGLCRSTNFGFEMYETNTIRVCTRVFDNENVDVHVPAGDNPSGELGSPRCSTSSAEVPWDDASLFSAGVVPNLPGPTDAYYPSSADLFMRLGPQERIRTEGWGSACEDFDLPNCTAGWKCPAGFRCMQGGVCQDARVQCVRHDDCSGGRMCTGLGTCVDPRITVMNKMAGNVSFMAHAPRCSGESFSMQGVSPWGYVPDLLETHGMCSYRHWREYLYTRDQCKCSNATGRSCNINGTECRFYQFDQQSSNNMWWDQRNHYPNRLKMLPTTCDRDYQRFQWQGVEMQGCAPSRSNVRLMKPDRMTQGFVTRDTAWRTYEPNSRTVPLANMPLLSTPTFGFLGFSSDPKIQSCSKVQQCYSDIHTRNGLPSMIAGSILRPDRNLASGNKYDPNDFFRCGAVGYLDTATGRCRLDTRVLPLYSILCGGSAVTQTCADVLVANVQELCKAVPLQYEMKYSIIHDVVIPSITNLFFAFRAATTFTQHLSMTQCMSAVYGALRTGPYESKGLYFPFTFTLFEFPFAWFYQCIVQGGVRPDQDLSKVLYVCSNYERPSQKKMGVYVPTNDDFVTYTSNMRGGYLRDVVQQQVNTQYARAEGAWRKCVASAQTRFYNAKQDRSYPVCHSKKTWNLTTGTYEIQRAIETYLRRDCASNVRAVMLRNINQRFKLQLDMSTLLSFLTYNDGEMRAQTFAASQKPLLTYYILNFGLQVLQQQKQLGNLRVAQATSQSPSPVRMDSALPSLTDPTYLNQRDGAWQQTMQPNAADSANAADDTACTEARQKLYTSGKPLAPNAEWDTDRLAGLQTWVEVCPTYTTGLFNCHLDTIRDDSNRPYSFYGSDPIERFQNYADVLYGYARDCYTRELQTLPASTPIQPSTLNFFEDEAGLKFGDEFQLDFSRVAKYMVNIQPDMNVPVMCLSGSQVIDYANCTDPNYAALKEHVRQRYTIDTGAVIPERHQMDWTVSREMMDTGAIFSFASTARNTSRQFMGRLFDDASTCSGAEGRRIMSTFDKMCSYTSSTALMSSSYVSPWLAGEWNPFDQCDVDTAGPTDGFVETINVQCAFDTFCMGSTRVAFDSSVPYYKEMPYFAACKSKQGLKTTQLNVNDGTVYNLCKHQLQEDSVCLHAQGMLGGTDGFPMEDYDVDADMYSIHNFTQVPDGDGTLFGNVLLKGRRADYGFVRMPGAHIGGHQLVMNLENSLLRIKYMPLKEVSAQDFIENLGLTDVQDWVQAWRDSVASDHRAYVSDVYEKASYLGKDARGQPLMGWDCPIRRRAFYGGSVQGFGPSLPGPRRSRRIFGDLTGQQFAHPTQRRAQATEFGTYVTSNGFCFCPVSPGVDPAICQIRVTNSQHNCSLARTLAAVQGVQWGWSKTFQVQNTGTTTVAASGPMRCNVQVDWPFVKGALRDGQNITADDIQGGWTTASDTEGQRCHVLDRAPDFSYLFVSKNELRPTGRSTLSDGVCHTGRVQQWTGTQQGKRCLRVGKDTQSANVLCNDGTALVRIRPTKRLPSAQAAARATTRKRCDRCARPPVFRTRGGAKMEAESSFGVPFRVSAERVLANDLLQAICAENDGCRSKLNLTAWKPGNFLRTFLSTPAQLFTGQALNLAYNNSQTLRPVAPPDDSALWRDPWVHCPTSEALRTGVNCTGSIEKGQWRRDKVGTCSRAISSALRGGPDPMAKTTVCNLDSSLSELCAALQQARSLVASANCLGSGNPDCALREFVYTPSTWETSNQEFVHDTVTNFYKLSDSRCLTSSSDCVCPVEPALAAFLADKSYRLQQCSAVSVSALRSILLSVRQLGAQICITLSYAVSMVLDLLLTMSTEGFAAAKQSMLLNYAELKRSAGGARDTLADLIMDIAFQNGNVGPWLQERIYKGCEFINKANRYFTNFWCGFLVTKMPVFLGSLKSVGFWIETGFSVVNDVFQTILRNALPDVMMSLYQKGYDAFFAATKYKEKTAAYDRKKALNLVNPRQNGILPSDERATADNNKVMQNLGESNIDKTRKGANVASSIPGPIAIVASLVDVGITIYQTYEQVEHLKKLVEIAEKFPTSLTLFDFSSFYKAIDDLVEYIEFDLTCYDVIQGQDVMQCSRLALPDPIASDVNQLSPTATACWADAQQRQVGVSTLYSCSATSTCCVDVLCASQILCASCPAQTAPGYRNFGCNTVVQRCQCNVQTVAVSRCMTHQDCGASSSCSLLTSLGEVSFGTLSQCSLCSMQPVCMVGSSPQSGTCTCLTTGDLEVDRCSAPVGAPVLPEPGRLCGYTQQGGSYYAWRDLALVLCANALSPVCVEVLTETNGVLYMPVASSLRGLSLGGRRRLLSDNDTMPPPAIFTGASPLEDISTDALHAYVSEREWNHTAAPCSGLAHAYKAARPMGPLDEVALQECVYWRRVGEHLIEEYNLTVLRGSEHFLMSPDDLAWAVGQSGVADALAQKPRWALSALLFSRWFKPLRSWVRVVYGPNISRVVQGLAQRVATDGPIAPLRGLPVLPGLMARRRARIALNQAQDNGTTQVHSRRLRGIFEDTQARLRATPYSELVERMARTRDAMLGPAGLSRAVSETWLRGAFVWRPFDLSGQCPPADSAVASVTQVVGVLRTYYTRFNAINRPRRVATRLRDALPNLKAMNLSWPGGDDGPPVDNLLSLEGLGAWGLRVVLAIFNVRMADILSFLSDPCDGQECVQANRWTLTYLIDSNLFCDFEGVMYCTDYRRDIFTSTALVILFYAALYALLKGAMLDTLASVLVYTVPFAVLWMSLGVSFTCLPMLPTCLLDVMLDKVTWMIPLETSIPRALVAANGTSLRSCTELGIVSWTDPLAFLWCDAGFCDGWSNSTLPGIGVINWERQRRMVSAPDADAFRTCAVLGLMYTLPVLLAVPLVVGLLAGLVAGLLDIMPFALNLIWHIVLYNHES